MESIRLKAVETARKLCTLVDKVDMHRLTIVKPLYIHTGMEQLQKWVPDGRNRFSNVELEVYRKAKREGMNDPCGNELELETSI